MSYKDMKTGVEESPAKDDEESERGSSTLPSEESSMDSIDEEWKSCLQATELQSTIMELSTDVDKGLKTSCSDLSSKEVLKNISVESLLIKNEISTSDSTRTTDGSDSSHTAQKTEAEASVCSSDPVLDGIPDTKKSTAEPSALENVSLSTLSDRTDGSLNAKGTASRNLPSSPTSLCNKSTVLKADASQASDSSTDTQNVDPNKTGLKMENERLKMENEHLQIQVHTLKKNVEDSNKREAVIKNFLKEIARLSVKVAAITNGCTKKK